LFSAVAVAGWGAFASLLSTSFFAGGVAWIQGQVYH